MAVHLSRSSGTTCLITFAAGLAACGNVDTDGSAFVVRDSGGISIASSAAPAWRPGSEWHVDSIPAVSIGALEGDPDYLLSRVASAVRISSGRIVVFDGATQELRYFDAEGRHLQSAGGQGEGPGEFQFSRRLFRLDGDSLLVADAIASRLSVFDPTARFVRSYSVPLNLSSPVGRFANGLLLSENYADQRLAVARGHIRVPLFLIRFALDGSGVDTIATVPGGDEYRIQVGRGVSNYLPAFGRSSQIAVHNHTIYTSACDQFEVQLRRESGSLQRIIRVGVAVRPVTPPDLDRWKREQLENASARSRTTVERLIREAPVAATMPACSALIVDAETNLWVQEYDPTESRFRTWHVVDPSGRWLGPVELPRRLVVTDIGSDHILGIHKDSLNVEYVHMLTLRK